MPVLSGSQEVRVLRRSSVAAVVLLGLLAGCGGSSDDKASTSPSTPASSAAAPSASPSPSPAEQPLTAAQALAIAKAVQLRTGDLSGYQEDKSAAGKADTPDAADKEAQACISGPSAAPSLADQVSSDFTRGANPLAQVQVSSETQVVATRAQAMKEFATLKKPETLACLNKAVKKIFTQDAEGGTLSGQLVRIATTTPPGSDGAARFSFQGTFAQQGITVKINAGLDLLLVGRAEITLNDITLGPQALPAAERDRLRSALVTRAQEAQR